MTDILSFTPAPPDWHVSWDDLDARFDFVRALRGCPQDPVHHAEGDVWIHTRRVLEALAALDAWRALPEPERRVVFAAALLHDVAKPACTRTDDGGKITSRGHSRRGENVARRLLWHEGVRATREAVAALVLHHQWPFFIAEKERPESAAIRASMTARCDLLALVAEADARGRESTDVARLLENVAFFVEVCRDAGCLEAPRAFPDDHTRFVYFRSAGGARDPGVRVHDDARAEAILMSGLPGAGKDTWVRANRPDLPVVSLDAIRREIDIDPGEEQGPVVERARELAREHLRRGAPFVWNATGLSREVRRQCVDLFADYRARVKIVYIETTPDELARRNRRRVAGRVPEAALARMLERWEVPDRTEAHEVTWVLT